MRRLTWICAGALLFAVACGDDDENLQTTDGGPDATTEDGGLDAEVPTESIAEIVTADARFSTLAAALTGAGLAETFADDSASFTVFAPTDDAFAMLPDGLIENLDAATLETVLKYHVLEEEVPAATAVTLDEAETLAEISLTLTVDGETLYLDGLTAVVETDIRATNGIIHVIDSVLVPNDFPGTIVDLLSSYPRTSALAEAVTPEVGTTLSSEGQFTVFAPTSEALASAELPSGESELTSVLLYHTIGAAFSGALVTDSRTLTTENGALVSVREVDTGFGLFDSQTTANIVYTDRAASNGVVHVIDAVLSPPGTLVEVAVSNGFSTLATLVNEAGLAGTLSNGDTSYTVFAPTNDAFGRLPEGADLGGALGNVLLYHVAAGVLDAAAVAEAIENQGSITTAASTSDKELKPSFAGDDVVLDGLTRITAVDIPAANGVIHVVDSVMLPADIAFPGNLVEAAQAYPMLDSLVAAVTNADAAVAAALTGADPLTVFAPYNPAFSGVDTTANLTSVLTYHVVAGANDSGDVVALIGEDVPTANGATFAVEAGPTLRDGMDNVRNVVRVDLRTNNGIIHVIDGVLMPPAP